MKDKFITFLLDELSKIKDNTEMSIDIDGDENIYQELLIPLMNILNANTIMELNDIINTFVDGDFEADEHKSIVESFIDYVLEDENEEFEDSILNIIENCVATRNTFNNSDLIEVQNKVISIFNDENIDEGVEHNKDNNELDSGGVNGTLLDEDSTNNDHINEPQEIDDNGGNSNESGVIEIVSDVIDEENQAEVNKIELKNTINDLDVPNKKDIIDEVFALVAGYDKISDQQHPHHVIRDGKVLLNVNGLKATALHILKPNASKNLTTNERTSIAKHILGHYKEIELERPEKLDRLANGTENVVILNIKDEELKEFGELFNANTEDIGTYIGLIESLLTDLVNSGIIDIEGDDTDSNGNNGIIAIKFNKEQAEEFIKYFDIMSDDIVHLLSNEISRVSYKQTDVELTNKFNESMNQVEKLTTEVNELKSKLEKNNTLESELKKSKQEQELTQTKFEAIIDFVKTSENVDDTVIQFVHNVMEAESSRDIEYMAKIGYSFMKSTANNSTAKFIKKSNIIRKPSASELLDMIDDNVESGKLPENNVATRIDTLSSYLD